MLQQNKQGVQIHCIWPKMGDMPNHNVNHPIYKNMDIKKIVKRKEGKESLVWYPDESMCHLSLKNKMRMIAKTRAAMTEATIHLFLVILRDMVLKIFLLLSMASSTPWSLLWACKRVCRCWCRSSRIETPSSSVSSMVLLLSFILSPDWFSLSTDMVNLSLWSAETYTNFYQSLKPFEEIKQETTCMVSAVWIFK